MILSAALMLRWLGQRHGDSEAVAGAERIEKAVRAVIGEQAVGTPDLGGELSCRELGERIVQAI